MAFLKDSVLYVFGEVITKALPFLLLPYLTHKLGVEEYGKLAYFQVVMSLLYIFIGLSQDGAVSRYYYRYGSSGGIGVLIAGGFFSFFSVFILGVAFYFSSLEFEYLLCLFSAATSCFLSAQLSLKQCQRKVRDYILIQFSNSLLSSFLVFLLFNLYPPSLKLYFFAILSVNLFYFILFFSSLFFKKNRFLSKRLIKKYFVYIKYLFFFGFPLLPHQLSMFAKGQLDRLFIFKFFTPNELGIYALGAQIAMVYSVIIMAVNKALLPYYFKALKEEKITSVDVLVFSKKSFIFCFIPFVIVSFIPEAVFNYVFGESFGGVKYYVCFFVLSFGLNIPYLIIVNYFFYNGKTGLISKVTLLSTIIYVILLIAFSNFGLSYVPFSLFISNILIYFFFYISLMGRS